MALLETPIQLFRELPNELLDYILEEYTDGKALSTLSIAFLGSIRHSDLCMIIERILGQRLQKIHDAITESLQNLRFLQDLLTVLIRQHAMNLEQQQQQQQQQRGQRVSRNSSLKFALLDYLHWSYQSKSSPEFHFPLWQGELCIRLASHSSARRIRLKATEVTSKYFIPGLVGKWKRYMDQTPLFMEELRHFSAVPLVGRVTWTAESTSLPGEFLDDLDVSRSLILAPRVVRPGELSVFFATHQAAKEQFPPFAMIHPEKFDPYSIMSLSSCQQDHLMYCFWADDSDEEVNFDDLDLWFVFDLIGLMKTWQP